MRSLNDFRDYLEDYMKRVRALELELADFIDGNKACLAQKDNMYLKTAYRTIGKGRMWIGELVTLDEVSNGKKK